MPMSRIVSRRRMGSPRRRDTQARRKAYTLDYNGASTMPEIWGSQHCDRPAAASEISTTGTRVTPIPGIDDAAPNGQHSCYQGDGAKVYGSDTSIGQIDECWLTLTERSDRGGDHQRGRRPIQSPRSWCERGCTSFCEAQGKLIDRWQIRGDSGGVATYVKTYPERRWRMILPDQQAAFTAAALFRASA